MKAMRLRSLVNPEPKMIDWMNANIGQPGRIDTWRFVRVGPVRFIVFAKESYGLMFKLMFSDSYDIEVLDEDDESSLLSHERATSRDGPWQRTR
jgi:hypothetical protein